MKVWSLLIVMVFLVNLVRAQDIFIKKEVKKTSIPWAVMDWSPGQGRMDRLKKVIADSLPKYQFADVYADISRILDLWKEHKNACGATLITPEREKWAYFTALSFQVPHEYVIVTSKPDILQKDSDVPPSLAAFPSTVFYFACTKNAWGKKVILQIDQVLQKVAKSKEYQSAVESWLGPETVRHNRKALDDFYQRRARGSWTTVTNGESP